MFSSIIGRFKLYKKKRFWRKINSHNKTFMGNDFNHELVEVGNESYGLLNIISYSNSNKLYIGHYCSIAPDVTFILNGEHHVDTISTFPFKNHISNIECQEAFSNGDIVICDDVWLGYRSTIMSGVTLGQGSVVAAGAVVTKDVPPYSIVAGIPARVIKKRFDDNVIRMLLKFDYSSLRPEQINNNIESLYLNNFDVEKDFAWFPRKKGVQ